MTIFLTAILATISFWGHSYFILHVNIYLFIDYKKQNFDTFFDAANVFIVDK